MLKTKPPQFEHGYHDKRHRQYRKQRVCYNGRRRFGIGSIVVLRHRYDNGRGRHSQSYHGRQKDVRPRAVVGIHVAFTREPECHGDGESYDRRDYQAQRAGNVNALVGEQTFDRHFRKLHAGEHHGNGRDHGRKALRNYLQVFAAVDHKKVYLRNEKQQQRYHGRDYRRVEQYLFQPDVFAVVGYKIHAERPAQEDENDVEQRDIHDRENVVVGEYFYERYAEKSAVGEHRRKSVNVRVGTVFILYEYQFAKTEYCKNGNQRDRGGNAKVGQQRYAPRASYRRVIVGGEHAERAYHQRGLAHEQ